MSLGGNTTSAQVIHYPKTSFAKEDIIGRWRELAREVAGYVFERFGYDPSDQVPTSMQSEIRIHS
jgi:hypothetical protein